MILLLLCCSGCRKADTVIDDNPAEAVTTTPTPVTKTITSAAVTPVQAFETPAPTQTANTPAPTPSVSGPEDLGSGDGDEADNKTAEKWNLSSFKKLRESFIDYKFNVISNGSGELPDSFDVKGEYDLDLDDKLDEISLFLCGNGLNWAADVQTYIEINGIRKDFYMAYSDDGEVVIIDLDKNDSYLEVAYFDAGPSDDPIYDIYRYDGKEILELGEIDSSALIDGYGREIPYFFTSWQFTPVICSGYQVIENNVFKTINLDIGDCLGKTYEFSGGDAFFQPCDSMPENLELNWDTENMIHLDPCKIKILDIKLSENDRVLNYYFVELPDGQRGLLYFWIGD
jgi:hypothetical protein